MGLALASVCAAAIRLCRVGWSMFTKLTSGLRTPRSRLVRLTRKIEKFNAAHSFMLPYEAHHCRRRISIYRKEKFSWQLCNLAH